MNKITTLILVILLSFITANSMALDITEPEEYGFKDMQMYLTEVKSGRQEFATGTCFGPLYEITSDSGNKIGEILRTCGIVEFDPSAENGEASIGVGVPLVNFMGLALPFAYDPFRNDFFIGFSFSVTEIAEWLGNQ